MKLAELQVTAFADLLASDAPAPGGGSAAALNGALGAALVGMVCGLTVGKKKHDNDQELAIEVLWKANALKARFLALVDLDAEAFHAVSAVFAMPKETDAQKAARADAMQAALKGCTQTPLEVMELSCAALKLAESIVGRSNASAASDLGCAALNLKAAAQGAWLNLCINLGGIRDAPFAQARHAQGEALLKRAAALADGVYQAVLCAL